MGTLDRELEELYRRRHGAFHAMLTSVTGDPETARDVVQEAFTKVCFIAHTPDGSGSDFCPRDKASREMFALNADQIRPWEPGRTSGA